MVQMPQRRDRSFAAKVQACNLGYERVRELPYEIIGNLDGDISFDNDHFEFLAGKFTEDPTLGVAGTTFREEGYRGAQARCGSVPVVPEAMLGTNRRLYPAPHRRNRLDGGDNRPHDGLEDRVVPGEVVLSLPATGDRRTQCPLLLVLLREERLLPRWASGVGTFPSGLPGWQAAYPHRRTGLGTGLLLGFSPPRARPVSRELMVFHRQEHKNSCRSFRPSLNPS